MTFPNTDINNMPAYIIYRDTPVGQPFDPTAQLAFFPPKDSDELFDALRAEFPHLKTHSERMREATIAYLIQERTDGQSPATMGMPTPQSADTTMTSPWLTSFPSMSTDSSNFSSPDMLGLATPSFGNSPQSQPAQLGSSRQPSVTGGAISNNTTPPALEQMTGVFSLSDSTQPKQRIRRKMTEAEKAEYRKRRIVKACDKCSKRKRKCVHNQPEMESLSKPSHKIEKPAAHHKKAAVIPMSLSPDPAPDSISAVQPYIQGDDWLDFTLLDDPMPEMTFDDLLDLEKPLEKQQYVQNQWPWGTDADFTMMFKNDLPSQANFDLSFDTRLPQQQGLLFDHLQGANTPTFTTGNKKYPVGVQPQLQTWGGTNGTGMRSVDEDVQQELLGQGSDQHPHQRSRGGANGNGMLWEGLGTDQQAIGNPSLQRTPHTHQNVDRGDALFFDGHFGDSVDGPSSCSGATAPRKELTRNIKNPKTGEVLEYFLDGDDDFVHRSESTSQNRTDRFDQANQQNRTNVRSVEGSGTKDLLQSATRPQQHRTSKHPTDDGTISDIRAASSGRSGDPSTEIYRLRHRIPGAQPLLQTRPQVQQIVSRADSIVKGGAYLRLDIGQSASMPSLTGLSAILPAEKPAHTRAKNPSASNDSGDNDRRTDSTFSEVPAATGAEHSSRPRAHGRSPLREAAMAERAATAASSNDPIQQQLHDTVRRRDHFGRMALALCATVLASVLLFSTMQKSSLSLSMLLLALFAPSASEAMQKPSTETAQEKYLYAGLDLCEGKKQTPLVQFTKRDDMALRGGKARFHGWKMTPHSSLRWCVGIDWTALCG